MALPARISFEMRRQLRAVECATKRAHARQALQGRITVICGPPGSGKSTYAMERLQRGDLLLDLDLLFVALSAQPLFDKPAPLLPFVCAARDGTIDRLTGSLPDGMGHVWIVTSSTPAAMNEFMNGLPFESVILPVSQEDCLHRIAADSRRSGLTISWADLIADWWKRYAAERGLA